MAISNAETALPRPLGPFMVEIQGNCERIGQHVGREEGLEP